MMSLAVCLGLSGTGHAQGPGQGPPPDCTAAKFRQFDFWIGEWRVTAGGREAGANVIESALDGCAIAEHWTSVGEVRGESLNFYDRATGAWHQAWTDERGNALWMTGGLIDGQMVMQTDPLPAGNGSEVAHRITWAREGSGQVRQFWESTTDGGATWSTVFDGVYSRVE